MVDTTYVTHDTAVNNDATPPPPSDFEVTGIPAYGSSILILYSWGDLPILLHAA